MSEETNENSEVVLQGTAEFEAKLTEFFSKHKKSKIQLAPRIADAFKGNEKEVLEHLYNKFVLKKETQKPEQKAGVQKSESHSGTGHSAAVPGKSKPVEVQGQVAPKSKKKLILIIVIALVVIVLSAAAFFMKDKLLGLFKHTKSSEPAKTEAATNTGVEQPDVEKPVEAAPSTDTAHTE